LNLGIFVAKGDVGVGTIVGSAVFNIVCVIGICGLFVNGVSFKIKFRENNEIVFVFSIGYSIDLVVCRYLNLTKCIFYVFLPRPLCRDSVYYAFSIIVLIIVSVHFNK
jgi:Ca2+/Na+ antiporter